METLLILILLVTTLDIAALCGGLTAQRSLAALSWSDEPPGMLMSPAEKRSNDMIPNPYLHETDQDRALADLSGQRTGLMRYVAWRPGKFLIVLGAGLKEPGQRMRPKPIPTKQRRLSHELRNEIVAELILIG